MRSDGWVVVSSIGAAGALGGIVLATVASGGALLPFVGAAMTLTGSGAAAGGVAGGLVGVVLGAVYNVGAPTTGILRDKAAFLDLDAADDLKLDMLQVIVCAATCNPQALLVSDAVRSAALDEVFGLSQAFPHQSLRRQIDAVLASRYEENLLNRSIARLKPFPSASFELGLACVRVIKAGSPVLNEQQKGIVKLLTSAADASSDVARA